jgi:hypothetical protein
LGAQTVIRIAVLVSLGSILAFVDLGAQAQASGPISIRANDAETAIVAESEDGIAIRANAIGNNMIPEGAAILGHCDNCVGARLSSQNNYGAIISSQFGPAIALFTESGEHILEGYDSSTGERKFIIELDGDVFADGSFNCGSDNSCFNSGAGADLAERIDSEELLHAGDVVEIDRENPGYYRLARAPNSTRVAGVISTQPGMTLGNQVDVSSEGIIDERPLLALVGTVLVKATAESNPIQPGDFLVSSSIPGFAMSNSNPGIGTIIGKALEPLDSGKGLIKMLVMLR